MATVLPTHRKQRLPDFAVNHKPSQHPLSPHSDGEEEEKEQSTNDEDTDDESVLLFSHPLSPHMTSRDDEQAQCISDDSNKDTDNLAVPANQVTMPAHPLSPHDTSMADEAQAAQSPSTFSSTETSDVVSNPTLTPGSSSLSTSRMTTTTGTAANPDPPSTASAQTDNSQTNVTGSDGSNSRKTILVINGPNLNLLGYREPGIYGTTKLTDITSNLSTLASSHNITLQHFQSNHEGELLDRIHACLLGQLPTSQSSNEYPSSSLSSKQQDQKNQESSQQNQFKPPKPNAIIINPGAFTHTSVALRDALLGISTPYIEVHISNVHAREQFRHKSFLSDKAEAVVAGLGVYGYEAALMYWIRKWQ